MANITRTFTAGKMNKVIDQRLLPEGQYVDAMNIRMGSTENSEVGVIENTKGNIPLTSLAYIDGTKLSTEAVCIGAIDDSARETLYWFVHDPNFSVGPTGKLDLIVSFNVQTQVLTYNVISINDGGEVNTTLNFDPKYLITGINIVGDLLFFTDNYNQPRVINMFRKYPVPVANIDMTTAESLLVIKKPPIEAPIISTFSTPNQENYLDTRFVSFAYRYRYIDGEYSATSQWSQPAFSPKEFQFSLDSYLNEGMVNEFNAAKITYNSGSPLVVGIDLLFKENDSNVIKVIEKLDKSNLALTDNTEYDFLFTNSKIFTILPDSELLRLYDNVPRLAQAQTIMGNRLMYGNYVEGYDLNDKFGNPIKFEYTAGLISTSIGKKNLTDTTSSGIYSLDGNKNIPSCILNIDLGTQKLNIGSSITIDVRITHNSFSGTTPFPSQQTENIDLGFSFVLPKNYSSVYELVTSDEFQKAVGTIGDIQPISTACNGITFTDNFNCKIPTNLGSFTKTASGVTSLNQPIKLITSPSSTVVGFQFPAMKFLNGSQAIYEYYSVVYASALFEEISNPTSLHSNRDYEIGIVYMDDYNRSTTALVSPNNTVHIPCGNSYLQNKIQVTIPFTQLPPEWATRYKFVIKPSAEAYDTIYCSIFFTDPETGNAYFLLEGENAKKVEQGDRFIVKADSSGPLQTCANATILEKESKASGFIEIPSVLDPTKKVPVPAGVYAKIKPSSFTTVSNELNIVAPGKKIVGTNDSSTVPVVFYPMNIAGTDPDHPTWTNVDYSIPAGSKIVMSIKQWRDGVGNSCEQRYSILEKTLTSTRTYDNMYDWFVGENVDQVLKEANTYSGSGDCTPQNVFIPGITESPHILQAFCINYYQFYRNPTTNELSLMVTGTYPCSGVGYPNSRASNVEVNFAVFRSSSVIVFETQPTPSEPDIFYENNLSLPIVDGNHYGNIQNQNIGAKQSAIIDTEFFNCFTFGNGVESYKIRDSIIGHSFRLGNRVNSVSAQDYREVRRFSDITYSGTYNIESNVNRLNVFNLGLLNFKNLETSFGPIQILDGRNTDVLVLQEDKISYVLADKNLLSDSAGGSAVTSVPEVLGTQIARTEKYGISFNPESYVQWGYDRYFTDVKRGAVIQLRGDSYSQDQLQVVSEFDMRTWFRDLFNISFDTQKIGGFDPYMNEYVLSSNNIKLPQEETCLPCGVTQTFNLTTSEESGSDKSYCVHLGQAVGDNVVKYNVNSIDVGVEFEITVTYNGIQYTSGATSTSGEISFNKNIISEEYITIDVHYNGNVSLDIFAECTQAQPLTVIQVVLTNEYESGDTIHTQYRYTKDGYVSPVQSVFVEFASGLENPLVSSYRTNTDFVGAGGFPPSGSDMVMISNKFATDTFIFNPATDKFKYATSNTLYANNPTDIIALLGISTTATPNQGTGDYNYASFTVPTLDNYLYLIWDFRTAVAETLCYSDVSLDDICCNCNLEPVQSNIYVTDKVVDDVNGYVTYKLNVEDADFVGYVNTISTKGENCNNMNTIFPPFIEGVTVGSDTPINENVFTSEPITIPMGVYDCTVQIFPSSINAELVTNADSGISYGYTTNYFEGTTSIEAIFSRIISE